MKKLLLISLLVTSGLAQAAEAIPDVVKTFSEQQDIKIIKKIDAPVERPPGLGNIRTWALRSF
jgi:thiol:disulfide interchange protein DsbG